MVPPTTSRAPRWLEWRPFLALLFAYYRRGPTAVAAWVLTLTLILLTVGQVQMALEVNRFLRALFDALEARALEQIEPLGLRFLLILTALLAITAAHLWIKRRWQLSWRAFLTDAFLTHWLERGHYHRLRHLPEHADNPDARIAEDIRIATEVAIQLFHSLLYSLLSIALFADILFHLTTSFADLPPGMMVWLALAYAGLGSILGWLLGWPLARATNQLQSREADFRFALGRVREKSEAIALAQGERFERRRAADLFGRLARAWSSQTWGYLGLVTFSTAYNTLMPVFPLLVLASPFMTGAITLGLLMQAAQAFERLTAALSWAIDNQGEIARCRASLERLALLWANLQTLEERDHYCPLDEVCVTENEEERLVIDHLTLATPKGAVLLTDFSASCGRGETATWHVPEGGVMPLLKAIAGLWPWGSGHIRLPAGKQVAILPARPFLPEGSLAAALTYPDLEPVTPERRAQLVALLNELALAPFADRLGDQEDWNRTLPLARQRQMALVRLLINPAPWWVVEIDPAHDGPLMAQLSGYAARHGLAITLIQVVTEVSLDDQSSGG